MMKKKSKKLLLWLFVLTFVLTGIAGCGTKPVSYTHLTLPTKA